jgi:hypothetical protein
MRRELREVLADTLESQGLDPDRLTWIGNGDGYYCLIPSDIAPPHVALDQLVTELGIQLRTHRETADFANRLRLRVAVHSGLLYSEPDGSYVGVPLLDCARLLNADIGRELLNQYPEADLVLLLTDSFYQDVVGSGTSIDPDRFQRIQFDVRDVARTGWAYVPGVGPPTSADPASPAGHGGVHISGDGITFHGPIAGRDVFSGRDHSDGVGPPPGPEFPTDR